MGLDNIASDLRGRGRPPKMEVPPTDVVYRVRAALGMTQEDLAREMNCSLGAVRTMERQKRIPGSRALRENFMHLARRSGVPLDI